MFIWSLFIDIVLAMAWLNLTTIRPASPSPTQLKNLCTVIIFVRFFIQKLCRLWFKQILWMDGAGRFCWYVMSFNGNRCTVSAMSKIFCSIKDARFLYVFESIFRSSPRRWPSRLELRCVRPSVRPSVRPYVHKKFFRFPSNLVCG